MEDKQVQAIPRTGQIVRQSSGGQEIQAMSETAGSVLAAESAATINARMAIALRFPRDWAQVRVDLLAACKRPGFAGSATERVWGAGWYRLPKGDGIEGFSIRFAEEAKRTMRNLSVGNLVVLEDDEKRIVLNRVLDLETNNSHDTTVIVYKTVEKRFKKKDDVVVRTRTNSRGDLVHVVEATEEETFTKQNNMLARAERTGVLKVLPGDIQAECRAEIIKIRNGSIEKDPAAEKKAIMDGFARLGVQPKDLKEFLGHDIGACTVPELVGLRDLWKEIEAGKESWHEVLNQAREARGETQAQVVDPLLNTVKGAAAPTPLTPKEARAELEVLVEKARQQPAKGRRSAPTPAVAKESAAPGCTSCGADISAGRTYEDGEGRPYCEGCGSKL